MQKGLGEMLKYCISPQIQVQEVIGEMQTHLPFIIYRDCGTAFPHPVRVPQMSPPPKAIVRGPGFPSAFQFQALYRGAGVCVYPDFQSAAHDTIKHNTSISRVPPDNTNINNFKLLGIPWAQFPTAASACNPSS